ncbi:hypothetical protein SteCoe_12997 [Stentor coeruleus]|uniref:FYVE-type domain-containing protein n=1 Tax=Stentor coeruleus TaxID=5963 RepID=A0A1R2C9G9_9CILI|nr:hypothetical protein SteCoe_12997 [Stentor coeruleus]
MGISGSKRPKFFLGKFPECFEFEVCIPNYTENTSASTHCPVSVWCIVKFVHKNARISVIKEGQEINSFNFDFNCEVINEQPEELIFTIKFTDDHKKSFRWRIRCKTLEEYTEWIRFLKQSLRCKWMCSSKCQICSKSFGFRVRKHHCRKCGKCICDDCSPIRSTLPELAYIDMVRICIECGKKIEANRKGILSSDTPNFTHRKY